MPKFGRRSRRNLNTAEYDLQRLFDEVVKYFDCTVIYGHRLPEEQFELFKQGRELRHGKWVVTERHKVVTNCDGFKKLSEHNALPSKAVDVLPYPIDFTDTKRMYMFVGFVRGKADTMGIDIRCGADWDGDTQVRDQNFHDLPHFELNN